MTRPSVLGDVSGLSPEAIEALPADAEERITITTSLLAAWGAVAPARQEQVLSALQTFLNRRHALSQDQTPMAMTLSERRRIRGMEAAVGGREATPVVEEVFRFTDRMYRAETANDAYEAALDTITRALGCSRASILLFDDAGIMRFTAWRGLSDAYRRAVEGHSPWTRDVKDPQPVCIQNVEAADLPEFLKDILKAEQIGALAFFPLVANDVLIGKFITYYDARHVFSDAELTLAITIARQLGFSLERRSREGIACDPKAIGVGTHRQPTAPENQHPTDPRQRCSGAVRKDPRRRRGHHGFRLREHANVLP